MARSLRISLAAIFICTLASTEICHAQDTPCELSNDACLGWTVSNEFSFHKAQPPNSNSRAGHHCQLWFSKTINVGSKYLETDSFSLDSALDSIPGGNKQPIFLDKEISITAKAVRAEDIDFFKHEKIELYINGKLFSTKPYPSRQALGPDTGYVHFDVPEYSITSIRVVSSVGGLIDFTAYARRLSNIQPKNVSLRLMGSGGTYHGAISEISFQQNLDSLRGCENFKISAIRASFTHDFAWDFHALLSLGQKIERYDYKPNWPVERELAIVPGTPVDIATPATFSAWDGYGWLSSLEIDLVRN